MYDRGAQDAEQDDLNPFYYQHYYYYRRGYDDTRRGMRAGPGGRRLLRLAPLALVLLVAFGGSLWLLGRSRVTPEEPVVAAIPSPLPTRAIPPTPTTAPTATLAPTTAPALGIGGRARIANLGGAPLRARETPGLSPIVARIPEGSEVTIREGPVEADGYTWWRVEAGEISGWVAERSPEGTPFLEPVP